VTSLQTPPDLPIPPREFLLSAGWVTNNSPGFRKSDATGFSQSNYFKSMKTEVKHNPFTDVNEKVSQAGEILNIKPGVLTVLGLGPL
jgi:hypothetical protein